MRQVSPVLDRAGWMPHYGSRSNQVRRMESGMFHEFWHEFWPSPGGRRRRPVMPRFK
ncbi:MAG: hypothetical protein ACREFB_09810 [Stellaceae bacterium]